MHGLILGVSDDFTWTLLGRIPCALILTGLALHARRGMGTPRALLGLSGFCCGAMAGVAAVPSLVGALGGGTLALLATWRWLKAPPPEPAPYALGLVLLVIIGRLGCFFAGCCFGRPFDGPWAVHYGPGTFAQVFHADLGWVDRGAPSVGVHPTQLYESLALVAWLAAAPMLRRALRSDGAWSALTGAYYLVVRAAIDPLRAMLNTRSSAIPVGPLSAFQVGALLSGVALVGLAFVCRRREASVPPRRRYFSPFQSGAALVRRGSVAYALQAALALAAQPEGTRFLRLYAVASLALSAAALLVEHARAGVGAPRWALAAAAALLIFPIGLRADDGTAVVSGTRWIYAAVPGTGQLVRIGTTSTPADELIRRYTALDADVPPLPPHLPPAPPALDGGIPPASVPLDIPFAAPPVPDSGPQPRAIPALYWDGGFDTSAEPPPLASAFGIGAPPPPPPQGVLVPAPPGLQVGVFVLGGQQTFQQVGCPGSVEYLSFIRAGATVGGEVTPGAFWQARASVIIPTAPPSSPPSSGNGYFVSASGIFEYNWRLIGLGGGLALGGGDLGTNFLPWYPTQTGPGTRLQIMPLVYLRLGPPTVFAFEVGTGSRYELEEGPFLALRFGSDAPGGLAARLGLETVWLPDPLAQGMVFLDVGVPVLDTDRLNLRLQFGGDGAWQGGMQYRRYFEW